jgi:hydroxypyruvate reductase
MNKRIELLAAGFVPPDAMAELESRYLVHRLFESDKPEQMLAEVAARIPCIVGTSHADIPASLINALPNLKQISIYGTGYEKIEIEAAFKRNIPVTNTPDVMTNDVADLGMGLILAVVRRIKAADNFVSAGRCHNENMPFAHSIRGLKLGIVGLGKIGRELANRAESFGMQISYLGRTEQTDVNYPYYSNLVKIATDVDVLILTVPGGKETQHMVDETVLNALGAEGTLINIARGSLVDEAVLVLALQEGRLGAAGLDVFADLADPPQGLFDMDNVILSPHRGSATVEARGAMSRVFLENVDAGMNGKALLTPIHSS